VLKALGINALDAQVVDFNSPDPGADARQFDMVTAGMFINKTRCAAAAFSDPDYSARLPSWCPRATRRAWRASTT